MIASYSADIETLNSYGTSIGMTNEELNTRAILSMIMTHESCNDPDACNDEADAKRYFKKNGGGYLESLAVHPGKFIVSYKSTTDAKGKKHFILDKNGKKMPNYGTAARAVQSSYII